MVVKTFMPSKTSICSNLLLETIVKTKKNTQKCPLCYDENAYNRAFNAKIKERMTCAIREGGYLKLREMQDKLQITVIAKIWSNVAALLLSV